MAGSTIGSAPSGENTSPDGTEKIPLSGSKFIQIANLIGRKLRETAGPTTLSMGSVTDGQYLKRSGTNIIGGSTDDGWIPVTGTWTYASSSTITVPSGAASIYSIGDKIKLTQTTVKYFYIVAVADTLLTVAGGNDYSVANAAISSIYYSKITSPLGFPQWFTTGSITFTVGDMDDAAGGQPTTATSIFVIAGRTVNGTMLITGTKAGTSDIVRFTRPSTLPAPVTISGYSVIGVANAANVPINGCLALNGDVSNWIFRFNANITDNTALSVGVAGNYTYPI